MPARHKGLEAVCISAERYLEALVDERGCRRDIRSNGWIEFSFRENRSGRRNEFSSFGADQLIRNFTGPQAWSRSGPDVFADALVPVAGDVPGFFYFRFPARLPTAHGFLPEDPGAPPQAASAVGRAGQTFPGTVVTGRETAGLRERRAGNATAGKGRLCLRWLSFGQIQG